jgi:allantoin racemase
MTKIMVIGMGKSLGSPSRDGTDGRSPGSFIPSATLGGSYQSYASPGTQVDSVTPDDYVGPDPSYDTGGSDRHLRWYMSIPAIVQKTVWAEKNGYDAVIQSNQFEHGVEAARLAVKIPVFGLCRTTMHIALQFADRIGVTVPLDGYFVLARNVLRAHQLEQYVSGMKSLAFDDVPPPDQIPTLRPIMYERTIEIMRSLVKDTGAECIVPLGGAVIPAILDPEVLTKEVGAPVYNPRLVGIRMAEMAVTLGLTQSPLTYTRGTLLEVK